MIKTIHTATVIGVKAYLVQVEVDIRHGLPGETIVGLPNTVVRESKSRLKAAIRQAGFEYPLLSYTVNLAPANLRKTGPFFDLPIAVAILVATKQIDYCPYSLYVGELGLNGELKSIPALPIISKLVDRKAIKTLVYPVQNNPVATFIRQVPLMPLRSLADLKKNTPPIIHKAPLSSPIPQASKPTGFVYHPDLETIVGHRVAKRALTLAALGRLNTLLVGPPGSGKSMLAKTIQSLIPDLDDDEFFEHICVQSLSDSCSSHRRPSFFSPHHSMSMAGLIGGGPSGIPGVLTKSHNGVLFLDELGEIDRKTLDVLRTPLECHEITLSRQSYTLTFPCDVLLLAAMNPCACGFFGSKDGHCMCSEQDIKHYWKHLSGPFLDRFDMILYVDPIPVSTLMQTEQPKSKPPLTPKHDQTERYQAFSTSMVKRQKTRQSCFNGRLSSDMLTQFLKDTTLVSTEANACLQASAKAFNMSSRTIHNVLKVAFTIADCCQTQTQTQTQTQVQPQVQPPHVQADHIAQTPHVQADHILEALSYRKNVFKIT